MPILLYCVGAIAFAIGAAAIGYGIPINEFSFGNTLIVAGAVAAIGGLVVLALGVVVSRLQQMTEALGRGAPMRLGQAEMPVPMRAAVQPAQGRMPFPPKPVVPPRPDAPAAEPVPSTEPKPPEPKAVDIKPEVPPAPLPRAFAMPPLPKRPLREPEQLAAASSPALPNPDEDTLGERVEEEPKPARLGAFATTLVAFFLVEMGDKTQIATIALGARFQSVLPVMAGTTIGMLLANVPAVFLGHELIKRVPLKAVRIIAALLFLAIGLWLLWQTATS